MFDTLQHRLSLIYSALFALVFLVLSVTIYWGVTTRATQTVRGEMEATAAVFEQIWSIQESQLSQSAGLLARDFGFRSAVATGDTPTVQSALRNLKDRLEVDEAFVLSRSGDIIGFDRVSLDGLGTTLAETLSEQPAASGVGYFGGAAFHAVAAPVRAPDLIGWVVFARELNQDELSRITELAPIALSARLFYAAAPDHWVEPARHDDADRAGTPPVPVALMTDAGAAAHIRSTDTGRMISAAIPITPFLDGESAILVLDFPLRAALAPYQSILMLMLITALGGLCVLIAATWIVARSLTRPIADLDAAASRLAAGQPATVTPSGRDEIGRLAHSFNDMAEQIVTREQAILHSARHDQESGLPNQLTLIEALRLQTSQAETRLLVATIGIERFHEIRNAIGYDLSAKLLCKVAHNLNGVSGVRLVARVATGTLAVLFDAASAADDEAAALPLIDAAAQPVSLDGAVVDITVTVGLARADGGHDTIPLGPLELSEVALEQARATHRPLAVFDADLYGDPLAKLSLMSSLISALGTEDIYLAYQPKLDLRTGKIQDMEALLRWRHPQRGFIPPDMFVELAEETGHIAPLTDWVIARAIDDQRRLRQAGHDVRIAVNISGRLICDADFIARNLVRIHEAGADLTFEITETAVIASPEKALSVMHDVRQAGVTLSIDDYGAGLSNLVYLRTIPASELKIDKAFVLSLDSNKADALLVKSTIDLAHSLGMKVTAEGVENAPSLAMLAAMGADYGQGYHISRPQALDGIMEWLDALPGGVFASDPQALDGARRPA